MAKAKVQIKIGIDISDKSTVNVVDAEAELRLLEAVNEFMRGPALNALVDYGEHLRITLTPPKITVKNNVTEIERSEDE